MALNIVVTVLIFSTSVFLIWWFTKDRFIEEYGIKMWRLGSSRLSYWQSAIFMSMGVTFFFLYLLKWANVLTF